MEAWINDRCSNADKARDLLYQAAKMPRGYNGSFCSGVQASIDKLESLAERIEGF